MRVEGFSTERLYVREFTPDDAAAAHAFMGDPRVYERDSESATKDVEETRQRVARLSAQQGQEHREDYDLAIVLRETDEVIGQCGIQITSAQWPVDPEKPEKGGQRQPLGNRHVKLATAFWNQGLARELARPLLRFGFEVLQLAEVYADPLEANEASWRALERAGMRHRSPVEGVPATYSIEGVRRYYSMTVEEWWTERCLEVRDQMAAHVYPRTCPISAFEQTGRGFVWGTGNYVQLTGATHLLTNAHVFEDADGRTLGHLPVPGRDFVSIPHANLATWPIDAGLARLDPACPLSPGAVVTPAEFDQSFAPADGELLFWLGYPGSTATRHEPISDSRRRANWFDGPIESLAVPYVTQQVRGPSPPVPSFQPSDHVLLHYPARAVRSTGTEADLPNPKGMSGSLLWDTKYVASRKAGSPWAPSLARVCGLVWAAHSTPEVVVATRVECLAPALLHFIRIERAYFHSINRGGAPGRELEDWVRAEEEIQSLSE